MSEFATDNTFRHLGGQESLLLHQVRLAVKRGADKGAEIVATKARVVVGSAPDCDLRLTDPAVSRHHFELRLEGDGYFIRDLNSTNGIRFRGIALLEARLTASTTITIGEGTLIQIAPLRQVEEISLSAQVHFGGLIGRSHAMRAAFAALQRVAPSESTVLLEGESGTGKELAAQALHSASPRGDRPFVVVDCGAVPAELMESELFGHEKGAFSGAEQRRVGALEHANGGTVFLDEIGELPTALQPRLLRFLESRQVKRVGANHYKTVDLRVIAATNRKLRGEIAAGRFREDLYYRLAVVHVELPPLRERAEDIWLLAEHFARQFGVDPDGLLSGDIKAMFLAHSWPGNVRELRNAVERFSYVPELAWISFSGDRRAASVDNGIGELLALPFHDARRRWQDRFEREYLALRLAACEGRVTRAAEESDLPRQTFNRLLKRHRMRADSEDHVGTPHGAGH